MTAHAIVRFAALIAALLAPTLAGAYARFCASHDTLQFGNRSVGSSTPTSISVHNCGDEAWRFTDVSVHPATGPAFRVSSTCTGNLVLQPGEACRVDVTFAPFAAGETSGALWLRQTTTTPDQLLTFYGRGVTASAGSAAIRFSPATAGFGTVPLGARAGPLTVALENVGRAPLVPSALVINGPTPYDFGTTSDGDPRDCAVGRAVSPGQRCMLHFTFTPAAVGPRLAQLVIDAPELASLTTIALQGEGHDARAGSVEAIEFHHAGRHEYFLTTVPEEAAHIDAGGVGPGWTRTGQQFRVFPLDGAAPPAAVSVCRFFGAPPRGPDAHFFSASAGECEALRHNDLWLDEGLAFRTLLPSAERCPAGFEPVVRLWWRGSDAREVRHRYVRDAAIVASMARDGWVVEGAVFCSP
jgi:hypothetical protein